jgi:hypothetical protein
VRARTGAVAASAASYAADGRFSGQFEVSEIEVFEILRGPVPCIDSRIISEFPSIFARFRGKRFRKLWRGSRDGFGRREFHRRCDGHANTLTLILDLGGNVFGGFTPVAWESRVQAGGESCLKADPSMESFLFTLRNPHNIPERKFTIQRERWNRGVICDAERGPSFNDINVYDNCNAEPISDTWLGIAYTNDTGIPGTTVLTGEDAFTVSEIEVFEVIGAS